MLCHHAVLYYNAAELSIMGSHIISGVMLYRSGQSSSAQVHQHTVSTHATQALQTSHRRILTQ